MLNYNKQNKQIKIICNPFLDIYGRRFSILMSMAYFMDKHYILRKKEKENIVKNPVHTQDIVPGEGIVVNW